MIRETRNYKNKLNNMWPIIIIVIAGITILLPQIIGSHFIFGEDSWFHMSRAYEDMVQIKTGHYSYFLNLFSFQSSGRIVNSVYGPIGGYLEGLLLLLVKSWYQWGLINSLIVLIGSGLSVYYVACKLKSSVVPSMLAAIIYMIGFPFERWVLNSNFDGFGAMMLPWFILAGYRIYKHDLSPVKLALLVTVTVQIHLMTTVVGLISLLISFIMANCHSNRLIVWKKIAESMGLCILLTINVWGSLLEVKSSNNLVPTIPYRNFLSARHTIYMRMITSPVVNHLVVELFIFLMIGLVWILLNHSNIIARFLLIQGLVMIWISSSYFPWNILLKHVPLIESYVQMPDRFLPLASVSILLLAAKLKPKALMILGLLVVLGININYAYRDEHAAINTQYHRIMKSSWEVMINKHYNYQSVERTLHSKNSGRFIHVTNKNIPDYLPTDKKIKQVNDYFNLQPDIKYGQQVINNRVPMHRAIVDRDVNRLTFNVKPHRQIWIPVVKYAHTKLWLNHRVIHPKLTQIHAVVLKPTQRHNVLEAQYQPSHWYIALAWVEVVSWLSLIVTMIVLKIRRP